jgi:hypothetical protein
MDWKILTERSHTDRISALGRLALFRIMLFRIGT